MLQIKPYLIFNAIIFLSSKAHILMNLVFPSESAFYSYIAITYVNKCSWLWYSSAFKNYLNGTMSLCETKTGL